MSKYHFRLLVLLLSKCTWNNDQIPLIFWEVLSNWIGVSKPQKMPISHLYWCGSTNLYSRHSAWLDGAGKCRSCQNHPVDQRSPKGLSSQTSWTTSISWGSAPTYRTQRTFSLLHLHSSVQPPTPRRSARKLSDLPTGSPSKVYLNHLNFTAIICPPGTFSIQTLLLYFRHSHWLLFVLSFIVLSRDRGVLISGGRNARGKIMCFSFWQIFSILQPCNLYLFYRFPPSFCVLFVFWLDWFLDIFVITLHTQRNNTTWQLHLWLSNWAVFNTEMGCSISRPWPLHVQGMVFGQPCFWQHQYCPS